MNRPSLLLCLVLSACASDDAKISSELTASHAIQRLAGSWKVISFEDHIAGTATFPADEITWGHEIIATFSEGDQANLFTARNTTNTLSGIFEYPEPGTVRFDRVASTKVAQPQWADMFQQVFREPGNEFSVEGDILRIFYEGKGRSVILQRQ